MTLKELDSLIAKTEGKKSQASIGDIREIRKIIFDILATNEEAMKLLSKHFKKKLK